MDPRYTVSGTVCLAAMSNPLSADSVRLIGLLESLLGSWGASVMETPSLRETVFRPEGLFARRSSEMADIMRSSPPAYVFDLSGGDIASAVLEHIEFDLISSCDTVFCGYSDLTSLMNAVLAVTGKCSLLYQILNVFRGAGDVRIGELSGFLHAPDRDVSLVSPRGTFLRGNFMRGILAGGNIRCFLKLAGTPFFPPLDGRILLLEQFHGSAELLTSQLAQLRLMGVFDRISGLILGTFTELESRGYDVFEDLIRHFLPETLPVFNTGEVGHDPGSRGVILGAEYVVQGKYCRPVISSYRFPRL